MAFETLFSDPELSDPADGTTEDITTEPARIPWIFISARNSAFSYRGRGIGAVCLLGDLARALATAARLRALDPGFTVAKYKRILGTMLGLVPGIYDRLIPALHASGIPERRTRVRDTTRLMAPRYWTRRPVRLTDRYRNPFIR